MPAVQIHRERTVSKLKFLVVLVILLFSLAWTTTANAFVELNTFFMTNSLKTTAATTSSQTYLETTVGFAIDNKSQYQVGWAYNLFSTSDAATTTQTYSSTQMGPRFIAFLTKSKSWSAGFGYYLTTSATYSDGTGTSETWKGSALKLDVGYNMPISEQFYLGFRLNYSSATYVERLVATTTYTTVSYAKTTMYPSIYMLYTF